MLIGIKDPALFSTLTKILSQGRIAVIPCDTIYGIVGVAPDTEERIRDLKGSMEHKPFIQLIPSAEWLPDFTDLSLPESLRKFWPGPLTVIFPARKGGTVALRVPEDSLLQRLIRAIKKPLYSTSVNKSGQEPCWKIQDIKSVFSQDVDLVVDAGDLPGRRPSTVLDISSTPYRLVRKGVVELPKIIFS